MKRASLLLLIALVSCKRLTSVTVENTAPAPSASVAVKLVDLPHAANVDTFVNVVFAVDVNADGTYAVGGQPVSGEREITERARDAVKKSPGVRAVIRADKSVTYQRVIGVMDALKQGGISEMAFAVSPPGP